MIRTGMPIDLHPLRQALRADPLTAIMLVMVTFISSLIAIYSAGYMHGDEGYARFFAEIALFIFSMTGLVLVYWNRPQAYTPSDSHPTVTPTIGHDGAGVSLIGRF